MHSGNDRSDTLTRTKTLPALYNPGTEAEDGPDQEWPEKKCSGDASLQQQYKTMKPPRAPSKKGAVAGGNRIPGKDWHYGSDEGEGTDEGEEAREVMVLRTRRAAASPVMASQPRSTRADVAPGQVRRRHGRAMRRSRSLQPLSLYTPTSTRGHNKGPRTDVHAALIPTIGTTAIPAITSIHVAALDGVSSGGSGRGRGKGRCCRHEAHRRQARRRRQLRRLVVRLSGLLLRALGVVFYVLLCTHLVHAYRRKRSSVWDTAFGLYFCTTSVLLLLISAATPPPRPLPSPSANVNAAASSPACCTCCGGDTCREHGVLSWAGGLLTSHSFWYGAFTCTPLVLAAACIALAVYTGTYRPSMLKGLLVLNMPSLIEVGRIASYAPPPTPRVV